MVKTSVGAGQLPDHWTQMGGTSWLYVAVCTCLVMLINAVTMRYICSLMKMQSKLATQDNVVGCRHNIQHTMS